MAGLLFAAATLVVTVLMAMHPEWRVMLWWIVSITLAFSFALAAYYILERISLGEGRTALIAALAFGGIGLTLPFAISANLREDAKGLLCSAPTNHGSLRLVFFGNEQGPTEAANENVYRWTAQCSTTVVENRPKNGTPITSRLQDCSIFIVWRRPISSPRNSLKLNGVPQPLITDQDQTPYFAVYRYRGDPPVGIVELNTDAAED